MNNPQSTANVDYRDEHFGTTIADDPEVANVDHNGAQLTSNHDSTPPNIDGESAASSFGQYIGPRGDDITIAPDTAEDTTAVTGDRPAIQDNEESPELHGNTQEGEHALHASTLTSPLTAGGVEHQTQHEPAVDGVPQAAASTQEKETPEASQTPTSPIDPSWVPFYLSGSFFVGNAVVFACMIATLEVLCHLSEKDQGLAKVSQDKHYFWTYGPLSLLTIISAFWGQMEYRARQLTPWYLMSNGQSEDWLLLNYLTASTPGSLFRSIKSRHFLVSLGIFGSLFLRLLTVSSTGLLSLEYRAITSQQEYYIVDTFDFTRNGYGTSRLNRPMSSASVRSQFWAISHYNLTVPYEIKTGSVVESFAPSEEGLFDTTTADVPVFDAKLKNCQTFSTMFNASAWEANGSMGPKFRDVFSDQEVEAWRQWCTPDWDAYVDGNINGSHWNQSMIEENLQNLTNTVTAAHRCSNNTGNEVEDGRIFISMFDYDEESYTAEIYGLWCEPVYSLTRRTVTNVSDASRESYQIYVSPDVKEDLELGAKPDSITSYILYSLDDLFGVGTGNGINWQALLNQSEPQCNSVNLRDSTLMEKLSKRVWNQFSAFAVEKGCKSPASEDRTVLGIATFTEGRLCIQTLSLRLIEILLGLLVLSSISLTFCVPPPTLHRDPGSIAAHALEIARNRSIRDHLEGCGGLSEMMLRRRLHGCDLLPHPSMKSRCQQQPNISVEPQDYTAEWAETHTASSSSAWWNLTGLTWWFRGLIIFAAVGVAIALQFLFLLSQKSNGLPNVDLHGYEKYTWTYIPTLVLASLGLAFSLAKSNARILHVFQLPRKGVATFGDTMYDPTARISFFAVAQTALNHQFTLSAIILTGLLAPLLTIAASGLYIPVSIPWTRNVTVDVQDWFEVGDMGVEVSTNGPMPGFSEDSCAFKLVQQSDMPYPIWTHDQYAFASIQRDNLHAFTDDSAFILNAHTLALRGRFNCSVLNYYTRQNVSVYGIRDSNQAFITVEPPPGCHTSHKNKPKGGLLWFLYDLETNIQRLSDDYHLANFSGLIYPNSSGIFSGGSGIFSPDADPDTVCNDNREHYWYSWARVTNRTFEEIAIIHCVPYIEALLVNASFSLPTFQLMSSAPIVLNEASATVFSNAPLGIDDIMRYDSKDFFAHLSNDTYGPDFPEVFNMANADKLIDRVDHLYRIWAAQYLNLARRPANITPPTNTNTSLDAMHFRTDEYYGTITNGTRIIRVECGLLITMALCVAVSCILEPHTKILPKDPGSIASKMSLFADGEVWKNIPEGAEKWSDEEIKQRGLLRGVVLKMGWWGGEGEGEEEEGGGGGRRWFGVDAVKREGDGTAEGSS